MTTMKHIMGFGIAFILLVIATIGVVAYYDFQEVEESINNNSFIYQDTNHTPYLAVMKQTEDVVILECADEMVLEITNNSIKCKIKKEL